MIIIRVLYGECRCANYELFVRRVCSPYLHIGAESLTSSGRIAFTFTSTRTEYVIAISS